MKEIITGKQMVIEKKGMNAFQIDSFSRLMVIGNADQLVVATRDERRYFVLNISIRNQRDTRYFDDLFDQLKKDHGAGYRALMQFFMTYDLSAFDV